PRPGEALVAAEAPALAELAMHVDQPLRSGALVQVIDILRNETKVARPLLVQPRQRQMRRVRLDGPELFATSIIEGVHKRGVARERVGGANVLAPMSLPHHTRPPRA